MAIFFLAFFFLLSPSGADEVLRWEMGFDDQFQMPPIPGFESEMSLPGVTPNLSLDADAGAEPTGGRRLVLEDLTALRPDSTSWEEDEERCHRANFSFELPPGWNAAYEGDRDEGNLTLEGACALVHIGWFEDSGIDPESCLRQVIRGYRSDYLRFSILTAEPGKPVTIDGRSGSSLNVYYMYGGEESQKRIVAWSSPLSDRFFYASFWSCPEVWDENLEKFELVLESFRDEGSERYVELEPRSSTLDGWGTVLLETLSSYHFESFVTPTGPEVEVRVAMKSHREEGKVSQLASEEIVSPIRKMGDPPREAALQKLLRERGYEVAVLKRGGAYWVVVQGPEGGWQAISSAAPGAEKGLGTLIRSGEAGWYRGLVVDGPYDLDGENDDLSSDQAVIEKDCDPPQLVHLQPVAEVNLTWILALEDLLDLYRFSQVEPDPGFFRRAQICWALLEREGYDALLVTGYEGHTLLQEMWVVVSHPVDKGYVAVKPVAAVDGGGIGEIISDAERFDGVAYETSLQYSCLHPDRGLSIDPRMVKTPDPG